MSKKSGSGIGPVAGLVLATGLVLLGALLLARGHGSGGSRPLTPEDTTGMRHYVATRCGLVEGYMSSPRITHDSVTWTYPDGRGGSTHPWISLTGGTHGCG